MTLTGISFSISFSVVLLGVLLLLIGVVLLVKRIKTAGIIVAFLGIAVTAVPVLAYLYIVAVMR